MKSYKIQFSDNMDSLLARRAAIKRTNLATILKRAIATYEYLVEKMMKNPELKVALVDKDGKVVEFFDFEL